MKKFYAILLALALMLTFVACGEAEVEAPAEEVVEEEVAEEGTEEEATEEEATEEGTEMPELDTSAYADLASLMATCYVGYNAENEEEFTAISFDAEGANGIVAISDATQSVSFVGAVTVDGDAITVVDEAAGLQITMILTDNGDGTYTLDMGEGATMIVAPATADDMMYILAVIDSYTAAVA